MSEASLDTWEGYTGTPQIVFQDEQEGHISNIKDKETRRTSKNLCHVGWHPKGLAQAVGRALKQAND